MPGAALASDLVRVSRLGRAGLVVMALVVLASCQARVDVTTQVAADGSGTVVVGVGLDADAMRRAGDLEQQLRVDDLRTAGWQVDAPSPEADGFTWVRARKDFSEPSQLGEIMAELTGSDGPFRDFELKRSSSLLGTDYRYRGTVDLTKGPAAFSDPDLSAALGGDPFGGTLGAIEQAEGKPVAEMVQFRVSVDLPGASATKVWTPGFADASATHITASSSERGLFSRLWIVGVVLIGVAIVLVLLRQAFRHRH